MTIQVEEVDITSDGNVVVRGHVSANNISVEIVALAYFQAPLDGIWEYEMAERQGGSPGLTVMTPFAVKVAFPSFAQAKGVRVIVPRPDGTTAAITRLKPT